MRLIGRILNLVRGQRAEGRRDRAARRAIRPPIDGPSNRATQPVLPDSTSVEAAYQGLVHRLRRLRRRLAVSEALVGLGLVMILGLGAGLLLIPLEVVLYLSPSTKLAISGGVALGMGGILARFCLYGLFVPPSLETLALQLEERFGGLQQLLISALQLWQGRQTAAGVSRELVGAAVIQAGRESAGYDFDVLIDRVALRRVAGLCVSLGLLAVATTVLWPQAVVGAIGRLAHPGTVYHRPPETHIQLLAGDARVVEGDPFVVEAILSGVVPPRARVLLREDGAQSWTSVGVPVRRDRLHHRFGSVTRSLDYLVEGNDARTPTQRVEVLPRPIVTRIVLRYRYPEYTGLGERWEAEGGDIIAVAGTHVDVQAEASLPLSQAWLAFGDSTRLDGYTEERGATWGLSVARDRRYSIRLVGPNGVPNREPVEYRIVAIQDRPPEVRVLRPGGDSELGASMQVGLLAEAHDDLGVAKMELRFRVNEDGEEQRVRVPIDSIGAREWTQSFAWDLSAMDLLPGDRVTYRMGVYDGNTLSGPGYGESDAFTIRFPSLIEIHQQARRVEDQGLEQMESMREAAEELGDRLDKVARELLRDGNLEWEERKELQASVDEQTRTGERLETLVEKLDEALDRLERSGLMAAETLRKMEEVQELLSQIESSELTDAMERLRQAMEDADPEAVQQALDDFRSEQDAFRENLDRAISLLRRVRDQQALDSLLKGIQQLAEGEEMVVRDLVDGTDPGNVADRQDALRRDAELLEEALSLAADDMADPEGEALGQLAEEVEDREVAEGMASVSRNLRTGQAASAQERAGAVAQDLQELAARLEEIRQTAVDRQKEEISRDLLGILHDLLALSRTQEQTTREAETLSDDVDPTGLSLKQARVLSGGRRMAERLLDATQKTFFVTPQTGAALGRAIGKMEEAAGHIQGRNRSQSAQAGQEAMGALNATAIGVRQALEGLAEAASAVGFDEMLERMGQLAEQQGALNAQTQAQAGGQTPGGRAGLAQLAARQRAIQQALEELLREGSRDGRRMLGDLGQIAREMDQTVDELRDRRVTPGTVDRQRRILSRLLDAQRSIRKQGWSQQREARRGRDVAYRGPGSLPPDLGEADNPLRRRFRDALAEGYAPEYQDLIRRYFESLIEDALAPSGAE